MRKLWIEKTKVGHWWVMTSESLEVRVSVIFDYRDAYIGGEKIKSDGLKRHTQKDVITH